MKLPWITRSRYERELKLLEKAYAVRTDDLRLRLESLIDKIVHIKFDRREGTKQIGVTVLISERENMFFSPFEKEEYWWYVGEKITNSLKRESQPHAPSP